MPHIVARIIRRNDHSIAKMIMNGKTVLYVRPKFSEINNNYYYTFSFSMGNIV